MRHLKYRTLDFMFSIIGLEHFFFKNYYLTGFSSDVSTPNVFTTEAPTDDTQTTHPITTTAQPGDFEFFNDCKRSYAYIKSYLNI